MNELNVSVLLLVFNRPSTTEKVFDAIRRVRPPRLYIAADAPRDAHPGERERSAKVREIATAADWPCEVRILFREKHLGCGVAVSGAIDWFFEQENEGIILEDDCLPDPSFFRFSEELLERYREDQAVMMISGGCPLRVRHAMSYSYFFSQRADTWGWASWKRAWEHYDRKISSWPELRNTEWLMRVGHRRKDFREFWTDKFDMVHTGKPDIWDYQWVFSIWLENGLTIVPAKNLVRNIGFGCDATHTKEDGGWIGRLPIETMAFPLKHPPTVKADRAADRWIDWNVYGTRSASPYRRILRKILGSRWAVRQERRFGS